MPSTKQQMTVYLPAPLYMELLKRAESEKRSANQMVEILLTQLLAKPAKERSR